MSALLGWLVDLLKGWFGSLGFESKEGTLTVLGLDNAGKTSLIQRLATGTVTVAAPTTRASVESFEAGGVAFRAWDLGGQEAIRHLWAQYYVEATAVVFMVDAADASRFDEAREVRPGGRRRVP